MKRKLGKFFLVSLLIISIIPAFFHLHIVEDDFEEIIAEADGVFLNQGYCFQKLSGYSGITSLTGITARPPLIPLLLSIIFKIVGHNLLAVYLGYLVPRLVIVPLVYLIARFFFPPLVSYLTASLVFFFPFFETYAVSTLKADVFVVAFCLVSTYFALKWIKKRRNVDLLLSSVFLALNTLSKETATAFSFTLLILLAIRVIVFSNSKTKKLFCILIPQVLLLGPFIYFSYKTTGRLLPSLYATARDFSSFPINISTYLQSVLYYGGINFHLSKIIAATSGVRLFFIGLGIIALIKRRSFELLLPPLAVLLAISLINTKVIQGDIVGNREILHRIAYIVPFVALYIGIGVQGTIKPINKGLSIKTIHLASTIILIIMNLNFIQRYFSAPFALDYTGEEFYITASTLIRDKSEIPYPSFMKEDNLCFITKFRANRFLQEHYNKYKTSAFPKKYKELLIVSCLLPLVVGFIWRKRLLILSE